MSEGSEVIEKLRDGIIKIGMAVGVHDASSVEQILEDVAALKAQIATLTQERDAEEEVLIAERDAHAKTIEGLRAELMRAAFLFTRVRQFLTRATWTANSALNEDVCEQLRTIDATLRASTTAQEPPK